jgi:hypothetical protein
MPPGEDPAMTTASATQPRKLGRTGPAVFLILAALEVRLTSEEIAAIEIAVSADAAAGTRYDAHQMQVLDREK